MRTFALAVVVSIATVGAAGDERRPAPRPRSGASPGPGPDGASWERAGAATISRPPASRPVAGAVPRPTESRVATGAGVWQGARIVQLKEGEARLIVGDAPLALRPGTPVGSDVVKSIGTDRIVLLRGVTASNPTGSATVVVTFDARGRGHERVYWLSDPAAAVPREVR